MGIGEPVVSIGMPVQNCEMTLGPAVRSILFQTQPDWELLVIDDGSSDETLGVAEAFRDPRIRILSDGRSQGIAERLNQLMALSRGKYFARMDGDDVAYPERLGRQVAYLECHPEVDVVGSWTIVFGRDGEPRGKRVLPETHGAICVRPIGGFPMAHPTWMGRIEWFRRHGYRADAIRCEDQDLLLRTHRTSRFANLPQILLGYREEGIDLKKTLVGRRSFTRCWCRELRLQGHPALAVRVVAEQLAKAFVESLAVGTRLNHRLLRHRARSLTAEERHQWAGIWASVTRQDRT